MKVKPQEHKSTSAMAQLLASHKTSFVTLQKGQSVKGKITKLTRGEILVDVGAKSAALVLEKDKTILHSLLSVFKEGDSVEVSVLTPEAETGQPIVSLRRYLGSLAWSRLEKLVESHEPVEAKIVDTAKSGFIVATNFGGTGFLPQSHISFRDNQALAVGDNLTVTVLELNRKENKIIFSQKPVMTDEDFAKLTSQFKTGQKVTVTIANVASFGLFVTLPVKGTAAPLEGFIHISEISWEKTEDLGAMYKAGQEIEAAVLKFDSEAKKIQLSVKRLTKDPFEEIMSKYALETKVSGSVAKVDESGVTVTLDEDTEGFIRQEKIPPSTTYTVGQKVSVLVSEYDKRRKRVYVVPVLLEKPIGYR